MQYAKHTTVSVEKSKGEIENLLRRYGADQFMSGWEDGRSLIQFRAKGKHIRFVLPLPLKTEERFLRTPGRGNEYSPERADSLWEQACRQSWRAMVLVVKAKLEAVESGITTFEEEFYAHIVLPNGKTIFQETSNAVEIAYSEGKMQPLLGYFK